MRLTRRDALAVLAGLGVVGGGAVAAERLDIPEMVDADAESDQSAPDAVVETMVAAGEVVYPSAVEGVPEFVETYVVGRARDESRRASLRETVTDLDDVARDWFDGPFAELPPETRDRLLHELGVATVDPRPDGALSQRVRFHVVNDLLYALYASPTGGRLVGIENPVGYPGGTESYRRGTMPGGDDE